MVDFFKSLRDKLLLFDGNELYNYIDMKYLYLININIIKKIEIN